MQSIIGWPLIDDCQVSMNGVLSRYVIYAGFRAAHGTSGNVSQETTMFFFCHTR